MASSSRAPAAPGPALPVDPNAPLFVAGAVVSTAVLGAATGASIGVVRSQNPFALSVNMAANSGLAGLAFFGLREYVVSPALLAAQATGSHVRRAEALSARARGKLPARSGGGEGAYSAADGPGGPGAPSLSDVRADRLLDSALSGALSGGGLSWGLRGRHTALRAGLTASLIAALLQLSVNQVRVVRLQLLAARAGATAEATPGVDSEMAESAAAGLAADLAAGSAASSAVSAAGSVSAAGAAGAAVEPATDGRDERAPRASPRPGALRVGPAILPLPSPSPSPSSTSPPPPPPPTSTASPPAPSPAPAPLAVTSSLSHPLKPPGETRGSAPISARILGALSAFLPVRRLSDDEYAAQLVRRQDAVRRRLAEIADEEQRMFGWAEAQAQARAVGVDDGGADGASGVKGAR